MFLIGSIPFGAAAWAGASLLYMETRFGCLFVRLFLPSHTDPHSHRAMQEATSLGVAITGFQAGKD